jgi:hypothetical protein
MNLHEADIIIKEHSDAIGGEENYRAFDALHFSKLSQLSKDPKFVHAERKDQPYFVFGRYVEDLFMGVDMGAKYLVASEIAPTGQMFIYVDALFKNGGDFADAYNTVQEANGDTKLRSTPDKFIENFNKAGKKYYDFLKASEGKDVISSEESMLASKMVAGLDATDTMRKFKSDSRYQIHFQVPLLGVVGSKQVKVLVDILVVDTLHNIIYPIDLKTTGGSLKDFKNSAAKYRYDIQASLYFTIISDSFANYAIAPFEFLVVSRFTPSTPKFFRATINDIYCGRYGVTTPYGTKIKGWQQLVTEYGKHVEADYWELPVEIWDESTDLDMYKYNGI